MEEKNTPILEILTDRVFKYALPAWFITDDFGRLVRWGGNVRELGFSEPAKGHPISAALVFMEGLLPLEETSMELPCVQLPWGTCVDALIVRMDQAYAVVVWDTSPREKLLAETQQKCHELNLLIQARRKELDPADKGTDAFDSHLSEIFNILNFAVLELDSRGRFRLFGEPPPWFDLVPGSVELKKGRAHGEDPYSFLGNFIQDVKSRWASRQYESMKSGLWIEKDHTGKEFFFEATALAIRGRRLMVISNEVCSPEERQTIIQKGRNLALHYHSLQRSGRQLKTMHDELEIRVQDRTRDLEAANRRLAQELDKRKAIEKERTEIARQLRQAQKMEAIGTLAGGVAHDFNNILAGIIGFTELSVSELTEPTPLKSRLEKILHAAYRARDLVRQILTFSHQSEEQPKPIPVKPVIQEALSLLQASLPPAIEVVTALDSEAQVLADQTQMHQVVMNLCTNAWHAMGETGGRIEIDLREKEVSLDDLTGLPELSQGRYLVMRVKDSGTGIPQAVIDRIFDPYFTTKAKDDGTGLGLSVVHGIVNRAKGCITVKSRQGKGSEFCVYLPVHTGVKQAGRPAGLAQGNGEHILFVDDEPLQNEMFHDLLTRMGYRVTTCTDANDALTRFKQSPGDIDLVITDMVMPGMSGKALAREILDISPDTPVILCSGYSRDITPETVRRAGIRLYLPKPVGMKGMARAIRTVLHPEGPGQGPDKRSSSGSAG